ncbi:MAG: VWA domain-containing protein [Aeromicrobium sp.]|uniref:vWA domain-containing protein n=1 Tax=Aeromicrobium sp. TaxID=1871063 RepID=UPI0039E5A1F3
MRIDTLLDVHLVAHESEDEVAVLVDLEAPAAAEDAERLPASLQVVLDRSGSMAGAPLEGAKKALAALARRLEPTDNFGLVVFDHSAAVVVPAGPLTDKTEVVRLIEGVRPGGTTDLSAGYLRGLREIRRVAGEAGGTVLVISDGHVNVGVRAADEFAGVAAKAYGERIVTSTLGYGQGYDESLLSAISRSGSGNHVFADDPDAAGSAIAGEATGLLDKVVQAISLTITVEPSVEFARLYNDLPTTRTDDGRIMVELGDLYAREGRKVLLKFAVPAMKTLGLSRIATFELAYVELPALVEQVASLPIMVNVVPGAEAAGRVPHPTVHSEVLFQEAQDVKRQASEAYERGEFECGQRLIGETRTRLAASLVAAPDALKPEISAELAEVERLEEHGRAAGRRGASRMSKMSRESYHRGSRQRGRSS